MGPVSMANVKGSRCGSLTLWKAHAAPAGGRRVQRVAPCSPTQSHLSPDTGAQCPPQPINILKSSKTSPLPKRNREMTAGRRPQLRVLPENQREVRGDRGK